MLWLVCLDFTQAQHISQTPEQVTQLLTQNQWVADYGLLGRQRVDQMGDMKSLRYAFKANHSYRLKEATFGHWQFNKAKKRIELYRSGVLKSVITTLDKQKFIMVLAPDPKAPKNLPEFEIYFRPKK